MRIATLVVMMSSFVSMAALAQQPDGPKAAAGSAAAVDPVAQKLVDALDSLNAYQVPGLPLKTDKQYAHTVKELEPFHHVEPFKTHFLTQLEYTGPGRSLPEPTDVKSVKIGFIGPLYPTVSVATGGKSHEEVLGKKMFQGCQLAIEEANARGLSTQAPLRAGRLQRQRALGFLGQRDHQASLQGQGLGHSRHHRRRQ